MTAPEFSHVLRAHEIGAAPRALQLEADAAARAGLVQRFGLLALDRLTATLEVRREAAGIGVRGAVCGEGAQPCAISGDPVPFRLTETVALLLTTAAPGGGEVELSADDLDVEPLAGDVIDVGEIAAQALALGLDPYPRRPGIDPATVPGLISEDEAIAARSPFAVLRKG
jgi:uncharacterized metal-binding protein YceD (DUF177 family)